MNDPALQPTDPLHSSSQYTVPIVRLQMVREKDLPSPSQVSVAEDAATIFTPLLRDADREMFAVLLLNTQHEPLGVTIVHIGTLSECQVHPREVMKAALLANAAAIICAHNHPSGNPKPSVPDQVLTQRLMAAGRLLGVKVLDHLVIGATDFCSMQREEMMKGGLSDENE